MFLADSQRTDRSPAGVRVPEWENEQQGVRGRERGREGGREGRKESDPILETCLKSFLQTNLSALSVQLHTVTLQAPEGSVHKGEWPCTSSQTSLMAGNTLT